MNRRTLMIGLGIWLLHALLLAYAFPVTELFTPAALNNIDSPFHQYQAIVARELWASHALVGYDPWFAAGHIGGVNFNLSAKIPALLAVMTGEIATAYKQYVFLAALLAPGFLLLALWQLRAESVTVAAAMVLGILLWWISSMHWYHTAGMVSFVLACYAVLPYIVLAWRSATEAPQLSRLLALGAFGGLGMLLHPLFPLPVLFAVPALVLLDWREVRVKSLLAVALLVPPVCVLLNIFWLLPSLKYTGGSGGSHPTFQNLVDINMLWLEALGQIAEPARGARLNPLLLLLAPWALLPSTPPRLRRFALGMVVAGVALAVFAALGGAIPLLGNLQPNRQSAAAYLFLVIPAAIGVGNIVRGLRGAGAMRLGSLGMSVLLLAGGMFLAKELANEVSRAPTPHHGRSAPEVRGAGETTVWLADWLKRNTTPEARVLFETSLGRIHDGSHIAGPLAYETQREFIGGPYVLMHHAGFWDGTLFGQPIANFPADEFTKRMALYNIGWVVAHSASSKAYLARHPGLAQVAAQGPVTVFEVRQPHSYFAAGQGRVAGRGFNRIELDGVAGEAVTLKYHYVDGLSVEPAARIEPVLLDGDPQPFIRIVQPPQKLTLRFGVPQRTDP
ncbi:hypothetical protein [Pseudoduganella sp. OTU4001]|uniref:hypothetical protein n=1 Tax=Pseudoduganella sp. OTU4001 TaxID=3043854 RepID=UPI00313E3C9C